MNWYLTKLVYRIICGDGDHTPQFDEQLRLIHAYDEFQALQKAQRMGHREQETFLNNKEKLVQWKFIDVSEMHKLDELVDGAEVYSRITEQDDADVYVKVIRLKAKHLFEQSANQCLQNN